MRGVVQYTKMTFKAVAFEQRGLGPTSPRPHRMLS